ncbi:hypothetical protein LTR35_011650 [Friedmanniomyces endolithicus]|nr:hypothetical protein LTR35_011650 [Friedmanniomyces endolithicus]KAK0287783.1 hypothetical protein LTS00_009896 [Friedmanniomyces endolithicus]KAK0994658.1 hypothetical protein LTR54_010756 [Friedmanniomyces endolithicus]
MRSTRPSAITHTQRLAATFHSTAVPKTQDKPAGQQDPLAVAAKTKAEEHKEPSKKRQAQLDEELMQKLAGISGEGGDAGIEYEDGKPTSMKKSVKNNMFRYI